MMTAERRAAVAAGTLLIAGIVANLASVAIEHSLLATGMAYLTRIPANAGRLAAGGLMELVEAGASVGIAIALYPVLRKHSHGLALGAVTFRTIEAVMYAVGGVITLSLAGVAQQYAQAAASGHSGIQAIADTLVGVRQYAIVAGVLAYITGALMYYCVMYQSRLLPRWLLGWGIAGEAVLLAAGVSAAFTHTPVTSYTILALPIAAQEITMGAWLILRGFSPRAAQAPAAADPAPVGNREAR